jgi:hypothetical protein
MRQLSSDMLAALSAPILNPVVFAEIQFKSETVRCWSGVGTVTWNGHDWTGLGAFLSFTTTEDSSTVEAKGISVVFSGIDATVLPECLSDYQLGLPCTLYLGLWSTTTPNTLIDSPVIAWAGRTDQPTLDVSGTDATITINCESRLLDMNVAVDRRFTQEDQQMLCPGDLCFQFVAGINEMTLYWGQPITTANV